MFANTKTPCARRPGLAITPKCGNGTKWDGGTESSDQQLAAPSLYWLLNSVLLQDVAFSLAFPRLVTASTLVRPRIPSLLTRLLATRALAFLPSRPVTRERSFPLLSVSP